jgi:hypothetical protein
MTTEVKTSEIVEEFVQLVDTERVFDLKELKQILTEVYNTKVGKKTKKPTKKEPATAKVGKEAKAAKAAEDDTESDDEKPKRRGRPPSKPKLDKDGNPKPKKQPTSYNNYVKETILALKQSKPEVPARELMGMAAASWKTLTQEQKDSYKTVMIEEDD